MAPNGGCNLIQYGRCAFPGVPPAYAGALPMHGLHRHHRMSLLRVGGTAAVPRTAPGGSGGPSHLRRPGQGVAGPRPDGPGHLGRAMDRPGIREFTDRAAPTLHPRSASGPVGTCRQTTPRESRRDGARSQKRTVIRGRRHRGPCGGAARRSGDGRVTGGAPPLDAGLRGTSSERLLPGRFHSRGSEQAADAVGRDQAV